IPDKPGTWEVLATTRLAPEPPRRDGLYQGLVPLPSQRVCDSVDPVGHVHFGTPSVRSKRVDRVLNGRGVIVRVIAYGTKPLHVAEVPCIADVALPTPSRRHNHGAPVVRRSIALDPVERALPAIAEVAIPLQLTRSATGPSRKKSQGRHV